MKLFKRAAYLISTMIFSAASLLAYAPAASANSYFGGNGRLTFYYSDDLSSVNSTSQEIYTVQADGSDIQQITNNSIPEANPQWNPDADYIAYDRYDTDNRNLYVHPVDADGASSGTAVVLDGADTSAGEYDPSWNGLGDTIAYHVGPGGEDHDIWTITGWNGSFAGGTATQRTDAGDDVRDTEATWNKDNDYLTFTRQDRNASPTIAECDYTASGTLGGCIAVVSATADIQGADDVLAEDDAVIIDSSTSVTIGSPQWSPVDNSLVYVKDGDITIADLGADLEDTADDEISTLVAGSFTAPTWSPDGTMIAVQGTNAMSFYSVATGDLVHTSTVTGSPGSVNELDWARATNPPNTVHECTTYVNEDCVGEEFEPVIPGPCETGINASITTEAEHGTPGFASNEFTYSPDQDYVGEDQYIYTFYDGNMNQITCTVNITVIPRSPDTGATGSSKGVMISSITAAGALLSGYAYKRKRFARR